MATTHGEQVLEGIALVFKEMELQNAKWGVQNHDLGTWQLILSEEVGEVAEASLDFLNSDINDPVICGQKTRAIENELVQVAAVAIQQLAHLRYGRQAPKVTA